MMVSWSSVGVSISANTKKPDNFDKYVKEIEKTKAYIKSKRKAFYENNNIKER